MEYQGDGPNSGFWEKEQNSIYQNGEIGVEWMKTDTTPVGIKNWVGN